MTRFGRRDIVKALRAPAPDPPPELGRRIKEQIPEDLFSTGRSATPARASRSRGRAAWALAASVVVAIGAGYLAARRFDEQREGSHELAAALDAVEAPRSAPAAPAPAQASPAQAPAAPPPAPRKPEAAGAPRPERAEQDARRYDDLAESPQLSRRVERLEERLAAAVEAPDSELGGAAGAPPRAAADAAAEGAVDTVDEVETTAHEVEAAESFVRAKGRQSLDPEAASAPAAAMKQSSALSDREQGAAAATGADLLGELLDAAAARPGVARDDIHVEGTSARAPGRFWALVSVVATQSSMGDRLPSAERIDVDLESTAARGYRLVASSAHLVATPGPATGRSAGAPLYRLSALYEIELASSTAGARALAPATILGSVRWRGGEASALGSPAFERVTIDAAGVAGRWDDARAELRLAVLAAELELLPHDAPAARIAPIEHDLDRLLADTERDPALSRRVTELKAIASGRASVPGTPRLDQPATAPARDDG